MKYFSWTSGKRIKINKKGAISHDLASAGFAAILASTFCNPKKVLIAGFDGLNKTRKKYILRHFHGKHQKRTDTEEMTLLNGRLIAYFTDLLIPYIQNNGATIYAYKNDRLRGIDAEKVGIKLLP